MRNLWYACLVASLVLTFSACGSDTSVERPDNPAPLPQGDPQSNSDTATLPAPP